MDCTTGMPFTTPHNLHADGLQNCIFSGHHHGMVGIYMASDLKVIIVHESKNIQSSSLLTSML